MKKIILGLLILALLLGGCSRSVVVGKIKDVKEEFVIENGSKLGPPSYSIHPTLSKGTPNNL